MLQRVHLLLISSLLLAGAGCRMHMDPGRVATSDQNPFVMIEAGNVEFGGGRWYTRYVVDQATQTCWLMIGASSNPIDCCRVARAADSARPYISWLDATSCVPADAPVTGASRVPTSPSPTTEAAQ